MSKVVLGLLLMCCLSYSAYCQPRAVEGVAEFQGKKVPAAVMELPYSPDKVEAAISEKLTARGHKPTKAKDYLLYRSVSVGHEKATYDLYIKTERKSRKDKESSIVYVVMVRPNEAASADAVVGGSAVVVGKDFLTDYHGYVEDYNLGLEIADQEDVIRKLEKKQNGLLNDSTDLAQKLLTLNEKMIANSNDLGLQRTELEKQRFSRCDNAGCDTYPANFSGPTEYLIVEVPRRGVLAKLGRTNGDFMEVATLMTTAILSFGMCK